MLTWVWAAAVLLAYWQQEGRAAQPLRKPVCMDSFSSWDILEEVKLRRQQQDQCFSGTVGEGTKRKNTRMRTVQISALWHWSTAYATVCMPKLPYCTNTKSNPNVEVTCVGMWLVTQVPPWCHTIVGTVNRWKLNFGSEKKAGSGMKTYLMWANFQ